MCPARGGVGFVSGAISQRVRHRAAALLRFERRRAEEHGRLRRCSWPGPVDREHAEALRRHPHLPGRPRPDVGPGHDSLVLPPCDRVLRLGWRTDRVGPARPVSSGLGTADNSMDVRVRSAMIRNVAVHGIEQALRVREPRGRTFDQAGKAPPVYMPADRNSASTNCPMAAMDRRASRFDFGTLERQGCRDDSAQASGDCTITRHLLCIRRSLTCPQY